MKVRRWITPGRLKLVFWLNLALIAWLVGYRSYLAFIEQEFTSLHAEQISRIRDTVGADDTMRFAVVGNIKNSVGLFERQMIPMLNASEAEFLVSAGNAVGSGGEDKYRALHRSLGNLAMPYLLTVGNDEAGGLGRIHFYDHYGPYFHAFRAGNGQFIFLDSTDPDSYAYQLMWLEARLSDPGPTHHFVFVSRPVLPASKEPPLKLVREDLRGTRFGERLQALFRTHGVTAVFSSERSLFDRREVDGVPYIITGGAGGLVLNDDTSYYHYVDVAVEGESVRIGVERLDIGQHPVGKTLESLWLFVHSLFYVGRLNFLLLLSALVVVGIKLYTSIFVERDYYRNFDLDITPYRDRPLRVAMVTNNYLPFIGGVPLSIDRLRRGLRALGHRVLVLAPRYPGSDESDGDDVRRVPSTPTLSRRNDFRLANVLSPVIRRSLRDFEPEVIHIHHPFWLGWAALIHARRLGVPAVFTYHTRLEHYAHYVPLPGPLFRNLVSHSLVRRFANQCAGVIVPTASAEEYLRLIGVQTETFVQPTGIDYERFRHRDEDAIAALRERFALGDGPVLVSVSRLSQEKNIDFILDGLTELGRQTETLFHCLIIGDGDERERLQARIDDEPALAGRVHLTGSVAPDDMVHYYQLGDVFLFASRSETQGMVILEAMAAHLPVVTVRSSGIDDVVQDGVNGYKTPCQVAQWTERLRLLLEDDALRKEMADAAQRFAADFAVERFAGDVAEIYAQVLAAYHQRRS